MTALKTLDFYLVSESSGVCPHQPPGGAETFLWPSGAPTSVEETLLSGPPATVWSAHPASGQTTGALQPGAGQP